MWGFDFRKYLPKPKFTGLHLYRHIYGEKSTLGILTYKGISFYTIELPWLDNKKRISCIPEGTYDVVIRGADQSAKFDYEHLHILNVPDRSYILFHVANYPKDILGCIGTGLSTSKDMVGNSRDAHKLLMSLFEGKEKLIISKL